MGIDLAYIAAGLGYAVLEYWLGRTGKVRSGSVLELLASAALRVLRRK